MTTRTSAFAFASSLLVGCFSPEVNTDPDTDGAGDGSSGGSGGPSGPTTNDPSSTTNDGSGGTDDPSGGTDDPTTASGGTDDPSSTTTNDPSTSGGSDPYCGDGNIDPGEDCDDGVDNNGLDQACLPDCNLNLCGDGNLGPDEFCDDGEGNALEVGACAPDCSTVIEEKVIGTSSSFVGGNYQPNPVGFADSQCAVGFEALFTVPGVRQATGGMPNMADDPIDWPLRPYTAYVRADGTPIWTTDSTPLLGVRSGSVMDLVNPIVPPCVGTVVECLGYQNPVITGMEQDWTPALSDTCNGWSSDSENLEFRVANKNSVDMFLDDGTVRQCSVNTGGIILIGASPLFYCVEQ